jgi:hypothetical protein
MKTGPLYSKWRISAGTLCVLLLNLKIYGAWVNPRARSPGFRALSMVLIYVGVTAVLGMHCKLQEKFQQSDT